VSEDPEGRADDPGPGWMHRAVRVQDRHAGFVRVDGSTSALVGLAGMARPGIGPDVVDVTLPARTA